MINFLKSLHCFPLFHYTYCKPLNMHYNTSTLFSTSLSSYMNHRFGLNRVSCKMQPWIRAWTRLLGNNPCTTPNDRTIYILSHKYRSMKPQWFEGLNEGQQVENHDEGKTKVETDPRMRDQRLQDSDFYSTCDFWSS